MSKKRSINFYSHNPLSFNVKDTIESESNNIANYQRIIKKKLRKIIICNDRLRISIWISTHDRISSLFSVLNSPQTTIKIGRVTFNKQFDISERCIAGHVQMFWLPSILFAIRIRGNYTDTRVNTTIRLKERTLINAIPSLRFNTSWADGIL